MIGCHTDMSSDHLFYYFITSIDRMMFPFANFT